VDAARRENNFLESVSEEAGGQEKERTIDRAATIFGGRLGLAAENGSDGGVQG
jgi:hypothetical protein